MSFEHVEDRPIKLANKVGVAIKLINRQALAMHVGLVFETDGGVVRMAHLAFHDALRCTPVHSGSGYVWSDCLWLQDPDYAATASFIARFIKGSLRNEKVDYGLMPDLDSFATGQYVARHPLIGLTCASYVVAVLKGAGFEIIDNSTWRHRPEDDTWSQQVHDALRQHAPARAAVLQGQLAPYRIRPDEAAFAAAEPSIPVTFDCAAAGSVTVRTVLLDGPKARP